MQNMLWREEELNKFYITYHSYIPVDTIPSGSLTYPVVVQKERPLQFPC